MTVRTIAVVVLALVCGASLAIGMVQMNARGGSAGDSPANTHSVIVAAKPLTRLQLLTEADLELRSCSEDWATEDTFSDLKDVLGKSVSTNVSPGDRITLDKLSAGSGVADIVKKNMRAYTIQTSRIASNVAGFIMPGNRVDVLLNMKGSRGDWTGGGSTKTLLQAVEVLAVAQHLEAPEGFKVDPNEMTSVTLHVTPQEANQLDLGQNAGVLTLSLRNPEDDVCVETSTATISDSQFMVGQGLAGLPEGMVDEPRPPEPDVVPAKRPAPIRMVTLRGQHRGQLTLGVGRNF